MPEIQPIDTTKGRAEHLESHAPPKSKVQQVLLGDSNVTDRQAALSLARKEDPGPERWSWRSAQFTIMVLCISLAQGEGGFDGTIMSSINSMDSYLKYFHLSGLATKGTGIIFGMTTVGNVVSFFPSAYLPDKIGRRKTMLLGNIILVKPLLAELTPANTRGRWVGLLNSFYYVGQILATGITIPLGKKNNDWGWRIPFLLQAIPAIINGIGIMCLPESPRWLYAQGKKDQAARVLANLHSRNRDVSSPVVQLELREIEDAISESGADKRWWDFRKLFSSGGNRYRFGLCIIISVWGQLSGNGLITSFLPALLEIAGITDGNKQRELNLVNSITSMIGALSGTLTVDWFGRRTLLLFGSTCCMCGMGIVAGLLSPAGHQSVARANAGISFIFLFMVFFSYGWTPMQAIYPTEVLSYENRAKGLALQNWVANLGGLINTFALPVALQNIKYRTYFVFMAWDIVGVAVIWLFAVETKGLTLEEMDEVFASSNPRRAGRDLARDARVMVRQERLLAEV